ncbi:hypothetical protein [Thermogemmatispora onikobensis]|uniref:hypothetical protein n=1 Tax=Thermogemmatispora onikobensis TaxID=732234 RepID=UPI0008535EAE|nr:hypothetical protein [Thermogemmatispora onikobensis]
MKTTHSFPLVSRLLWNWPWYLLAFLAALIVGLSSSPFRLPGLAMFVLLSTLVMLRERLPEALVWPAVLLAWLLSLLPQTQHWTLEGTLLLASLACVLLFCSQFIWRLIRPLPLWLAPATPAQLLALAGQLTIVIISGGAALVNSQPRTPLGALARLFDLSLQIGPLTLATLGLLLVWQALLQPRRAPRLWRGYTAGLLLALALSWEIGRLWQPSLDLLCLPPASYLIVLCPFLLRDRQTMGSQQVGHLLAVVGSCLLLMPAFILSIVTPQLDAQMISLLLALAESLSLFSFGIAVRVRFFVLGGAALVVGGAIRAVIYTLANPHSAPIVWPALGLAGLALLGGSIFLTLRRSAPLP